MSTIAGIFGSIVGVVAAIIGGAVAVTVVVVLWRSGSIPALVELGGALINFAGSAVAGFFSFLAALIESF